MKKIPYLEIKKQLSFLIPEQYNDAMSYQELLYSVINLINEMAENINEIPNTIEDDVKAEIDKLVADGTLENMINQTIFNDLNKKVDDYAKITAEVETIVGKFVTPELFGAYGDGQRDDTAEFNQAITKAKKNNWCLLLLGEYKISAPLSPFENLHVFAINGRIHSTYTGAENLITFNNCDISGLRVVSNKNHTGAVFFSDDFNNAKFTDVTIYYGNVGIHVNKGADKNGFGLHVNNFNISDCIECGLKIENCADIFIADGIINKCGVGIIADKSDGLYCSNVDLISCEYAFRGYCYTGNLGSCFFSNVLFDTSEKDNFRIDGTSGSYIATSLHFSNCWFSNNKSAAGCFLSLVRLAEITGCIFQYSKSVGLNIDKSQNIKITGCSFYANSEKNNANIILTSCDGVIVNGCSIGGLGTGAFAGRGGNRSIYMSNCTNSIIVNNRAFDNTANDILGAESEAIVKNNIGITDK